MRFLVDANVLSEPTRPAPDEKVVKWLGANEARLVVDPIILGEIRFGLLLLAAGAKRRSLETWFASGVQRLECVPWDAAVGLEWAQLLARLRTAGAAMPTKDSMIAATAALHGFIPLPLATKPTSKRPVCPFSTRSSVVDACLTRSDWENCRGLEFFLAFSEP